MGLKREMRPLALRPASSRRLPPSLARLHPVYGTPARILVLAAILYSLIPLVYVGSRWRTGRVAWPPRGVDRATQP